MIVEGDRSLGVPAGQPQQSGPECVSGFDASATPSAATGLRVEGNVVQSPQPQRRGPKTAAGKARIGLNALTHGISSARLVVPGESPTEWEMYRQAIVDALVPTGPVELALAERVATALWRLRRVAAYEGAAIAERQHLATASARLLPHPVDVDRVIRYEAHLSRQLYQGLHQLRRCGASGAVSRRHCSGWTSNIRQRRAMRRTR